MRNPVPDTPDSEGMATRLGLFADLLGDAPDRLWGWAFAETVLCAKQSHGDLFEPTWSRAAEAIWDVRGQFRH